MLQGSEPKVVEVAGLRVWLRVEPIEQTLRDGGFDALLLHNDMALSLGDAAGQAVLQAAGPELEREFARSPLPAMGSVVATSAGSLPFRFLLHAITSDPPSGRLPTERTLRQLARTALVRCEALGIRRLAVLASGASGPGLTSARVAQLFGFGLTEHLKNPSVLEEVLLVLPDQDAVAEFLAAGIGDTGEITEAMFGPLDLGTPEPPTKPAGSTISATPGAPVRSPRSTVTYGSEPARPAPGRAGGPEISRIPATRGTPSIRVWLPLALTLITLGLIATVPGWSSASRVEIAALLVGGGLAALLTGLLVRRSRRRRNATLFPEAVADSRTLRAPSREPRTTSSGSTTPSTENLVDPPGTYSTFQETLRVLPPSGSTWSDLENANAQPTHTPFSKEDSRPLLSRRYVLLEEIGRGGMGVVYLSWDLFLRRTVAIKTLREDPDVALHSMEALRREAAITMDLHHDGVVRLFHFDPGGESQGPFLVMEYVPWSTGERWIADSGSLGLPPNAVRDVGLKLCGTLDYAHGRGVLHLDIKPSNIFVDPGGERIKLADFGLARALGALQLHASGTPAYMAPEQKTPGTRLSAATDVYLLSATLWDLATGTPPESPARVDVERHRERRSLLEVLSTGLAPDPARRPLTVAAFAERLQRVA